MILVISLFGICKNRYIFGYLPTVFALHSLNKFTSMGQIKMRPAVYANHRRKDGTYPVKIVIYYKGKERKMPTHIIAEAKDLTRSLHLKPGDKLHAAQELIIKMQTACMDIPYFDLEYRDVDFIMNYIKGKLAKEEFRLDFFQFAAEYLAPMKENTRATYVQAVNAFARYLKKREIDINLITKTMVAEFMEYIENEPLMYWNKAKQELVETKGEKGSRSQGPRHVMKLARIFEAAKRKYNDEDAEKILIPRSPFSNHDLRTAAPQGQKALPVDVIQRLILAKTDSSLIRGSIDAAVVSFALMGANLADLYEGREPEGDTWVYRRKKTRDRRADNAEMRVDVPACIAPYVARLKGSSKRGVWLGRLQEMCPNPAHITGTVNKGLKYWCEQEGIEPFTFYALRKSWATLARREGVEKALVDECLAHVGDYDLTDIYAEKPWARINEANSKVLALFEWD